MRLNEITNNIMQDQNTHANGIFHIPKALNDVGLLLGLAWEHWERPAVLAGPVRLP